MVSVIHGLSFPACDPIDTRDFQGAWLAIDTFTDQGTGQLEPTGRIVSEVFCAAEEAPRTFLERDQTKCEVCDCDAFQECIPQGCRKTCGSGSLCEPGSTCLASGVCSPCGFGPNQVQCGGGPDGCGACPGGTMCVEGLCSALLRCDTGKSALCDVPDWCPVDVRNAPGPVGPGTPCFCVYPYNGSACQSFNGYLEFF
ncbi:MAG: hypothetical protein H6716_26525 [Polyangiaceae bacterium]|nr:hypothetical protein [Polyangiaceae bacterium]